MVRVEIVVVEGRRYRRVLADDDEEEEGLEGDQQAPVALACEAPDDTDHLWASPEQDREDDPGCQVGAMLGLGEEQDEQQPANDGQQAKPNDVVFDGKEYCLRYFTSPELFRFVIGQKGATRNRLQTQHAVRLDIPGKSSPRSDIVIRGASEAAVRSARADLDTIVAKFRHKVPFTHFVCIPLTSCAQHTGQWQAKALADFPNLTNFDRSTMVNPARLHLTLVMLRLLSPSDVQSAADVLRSLRPKILSALSQQPLRLRLEGVEVMDCDPAETNVLYAKVQGSPDDLRRLKDIGKTVVSRFKQMPYADNRASENVKFHATLANTRIRQEKTKSAKREVFDATPLLAKYPDTPLGSFVVDSLHLVKRGEHDASGFYASESSIKLPG